MSNFDENFVIGTWEMIEAWDIGDDPSEPSKKTYPWGNPSSGYWVYDKSGHFSMIIYPNPALAIPGDPITGDPQPNWLHPHEPWTVPNSLLMESFSTINPYAYFGTYSVEMTGANSGVIHQQVTADVMRAYTGTQQPRSFTLETSGGIDYINVGEPGQYLRRLRRLS